MAISCPYTTDMFLCHISAYVRCMMVDKLVSNPIKTTFQRPASSEVNLILRNALTFTHSGYKAFKQTSILRHTIDWLVHFVKDWPCIEIISTDNHFLRTGTGSCMFSHVKIESVHIAQYLNDKTIVDFLNSSWMLSGMMMLLNLLWLRYCIR